MDKVIHLSVHDVVDTLLRSGSIDTRVFSSGTMQEGTRLHSIYQNEQEDNYHSEVYLCKEFTIGDVKFFVEGRADGIIVKADGSAVVDEIKTTVDDLERFHAENEEWHLGQAKLYAYIYAAEHEKEEMGVRLTYISQNDYHLKKRYYFQYSFSELQSFAHGLLDSYYQRIEVFLQHQEEMRAAIEKLGFPYPEYRRGQKELVERLEQVRDQKSFSVVEAPTGIGKTAAVLFPFVKGLAKEAEKVFYLTSKNSIKKIALETLAHFNAEGAKLKIISLSSKEALCINDKKRHCNPDECPFARDYYQKISKLIYVVFGAYESLDFSSLESIGREYEICPFEFQLDLSLYCDVVIADYNHLFHPTAHLMRFFDSGPKPFYLLVDECHNLPSRVREMHSGKVEYFDLYELRKSLAPLAKKSLKLRKRIAAILDFFISAGQSDPHKTEAYKDIMPLEEVPEKLVDLIEDFIEQARSFLKSEPELVSDILLEVFYQLSSFLDLPKSSDRYSYYFRLHEGKAFSFIADCLDSREYIRPAKSIFLSGAFFSATLTPQSFYLDLLTAEEADDSFTLPSPFPAENFKVIVDPLISTFYRDRQRTLPLLVSAIKAFVSGRSGNYFVFFPSYQYLRATADIFDGGPAIDLRVQDSRMDEQSRKDFLASFKENPQKTTVGFVVMGGIFSEGIDLVNDRLIGAVIVGVGLPSICYENDNLRKYYGQEDGDKGYEYAYLYPGINKVFQAAGRVIRSEKDRGMLLLLDRRYNEKRYYDIYRQRFENLNFVFSNADIERCVADFFKEEQE